MFHFRSSKLFIVVLVIMVFATAAYAFANSNTMPASSNAGEGSVAIGGYTVSAVTYTYDTANPSQIATVSFTIAPGAAKASVSLTAGGLLQTCTGSGASPHTSFTCNITGVSVLNAVTLRVVASD